MNINIILKDICDTDSIYNEIMDNILCPKFCHLKGELISEIAISYLERPKKIEKIWADGYGKYFFIRTVINNVRSNTSPFYKNCIKTDYELIDGYDYDMIDDSIDVIQNKIEKESKIDAINKAYSSIKKGWFDETVWNDYYKHNKTFRQIEEDWAIDHCLAFHTVNNIRKKIKNKLNDEKRKM
jgi:hypothetical protein